MLFLVSRLGYEPLERNQKILKQLHLQMELFITYALRNLI